MLNVKCITKNVTKFHVARHFDSVIKIETLGICLKINLKWQQSVLLENAQYSTLETQNKKRYSTLEYQYF